MQNKNIRKNLKSDNTRDKYIKITKPTFNNKIREKCLLRTPNGVPLSKIRTGSVFVPVNPA